MNNSIWRESAHFPSFEPLDRDLKTDVLIIGGGMAGLLCAHRLAQEGVDYALVEAAGLCSGTTGNTTAKLTAQHGLFYADLLRRFGPERAQIYLQANLAALEQYRALCRDIDCDFREKDAFVYSLNDPACIQAELEALDRLGYSARFAQELPLPFPVAGAVCFPKQAQFHPLKFAAAISRGLRLYPRTKVLELAPGRAVTNHGTISADQIIVATHFPMLNKHGGYFLKLYQHRSYVLALENAPDVGGMYLDEAQTGLSFRNQENLLLLGGGSHRTGKRGGGWESLTRFARTHYPQAREVCRWAAQDCMSLDGVPYIGRYSPRTKGLWVASGFHKWGMTSSMVAAELLTDLILGRDTPLAAVFSPARSVLHPQLALNTGEALLGLLTPVRPRCPHMGCVLHYNAPEHSWDCSCHGSRFAADGALLDNPAAADKPGLRPSERRSHT